MKPYAIQTVPYHENGTVGFSLRKLVGDCAGKSAGDDPDGFEVYYQDGRENLFVEPYQICHGTLGDPELTKARMKKRGQEYVDSFPHWSEATMKDQAVWVEMWTRWSRGEFTDIEVDRERDIDKKHLVWMSGDELDAWEAAHIAAVKDRAVA